MKLKRLFLTGSAATLLLTLFGDRVSAAPITLSSSFSTSLTIPDNDPTGVADTRILSMPAASSILGLQVSLKIEGGFNGDYYAYLRHGSSGFAVLLNQAGVSSGNPYGYADSGIDITFSDTAANNDVHLYQTVINPNGASLTGQWQPDGRNIVPSVVSDSTLRTALLSGFSGLDPNGAWTLFVSDNSAFGIGTLASWGLTVTADSHPTIGVPEGGTTLGLLMLGSATLMAPAISRRMKR
jgi:subtilisin-like proprotein convertase family protein